MPNIIESEIREAFNVPEEVQLNNAYTEAQWDHFCGMYKNTRILYSGGRLSLVREDAE